MMDGDRFRSWLLAQTLRFDDVGSFARLMEKAPILTLDEWAYLPELLLAADADTNLIAAALLVTYEFKNLYSPAGPGRPGGNR
jgi:hypothetical protein